MILISQIINDLIDEDKSLSSALLKAKVLASRIQNQELLDWVNNELSGYKNEENLPSYRRKIKNELKGDFVNANMNYTNAKISTDGLEKSFEKSLKRTDFTESIISLERLINSEEASIKSESIKADFVTLIEENWRKMGNPLLKIKFVNKSISKISVIQVVTNVRNKLLDVMLELDGKYSDFTELKDLKIKSEEISSIVNNTIYQEH